MLRTDTRGQGPILTAIVILVGLGFFVWGALTLPTSLGEALILFGVGCLVAGVGGTLQIGAPSIAVGGTLGGVLILVGAAILYFPHI